jgi:hypothetical protein
MPCQKVSPISSGHVVQPVEGNIGIRTYIILIFRGIEKVWEITFAEFLQMEHLGEIGQFCIEKGQTVQKAYIQTPLNVHVHNLTTVVDEAIGYDGVLDEVIENEITIVTFEIMSEYRKLLMVFRK